MRREAWESSSVKSVGYDAATRVLEVEYVGGGVYRYFDVPHETYRDFAEASSKGTFMNVVIKPEYRYRKVR
jgi:lysyl-tRNA synthetase class 2